MRVLGAGYLNSGSSVFSTVTSGKNALTIVSHTGSSDGYFYLQGYILGSGTVRANFGSGGGKDLAIVDISESTITMVYQCPITYLILEVD